MKTIKKIKDVSKDYISPSLTVQILHTEGLLCTSVSGASIDDASEEVWGEF